MKQKSEEKTSLSYPRGMQLQIPPKIDLFILRCSPVQKSVFSGFSEVLIKSFFDVK